MPLVHLLVLSACPSVQLHAVFLGCKFQCETLFPCWGNPGTCYLRPLGLEPSAVQSRILGNLGQVFPSLLFFTQSRLLSLPD